MWPNQALQRFDGFGKPGEGFPGGKGLVHNQTELAGASEPTVPRRERRGCKRGVPCAGSLGGNFRAPPMFKEDKEDL